MTLDANDQVVAGSAFTLPGYDFQDIYADASGGMLLVSRNAMGSTAGNNCGNINNLCGLVTNYPTAASCYDMYMVRFDGASETWATKLTDTSASQPAYMTSATQPGDITFVWSEYAHNGRIAFDGANYAGYFGIAISVSQPCVGSSALTTGINIHQGDRMKVVSSAGALQSTPGFGIGCSHSGYERVIYDSAAKKFIRRVQERRDDRHQVRADRFPAEHVDDISRRSELFGSGQRAAGGWRGRVDHLQRCPHRSTGERERPGRRAPLAHRQHQRADAGQGFDPGERYQERSRAPLAAYGAGQMLAAWEESTTAGDFSQNDKNRQMYIQVLDSTTGAAPAGSSATSAGPLTLSPNVLGSRYQDFRSYPDGSVAYPAPGSTATKLKILRVLACSAGG